MLTSLQVRLGHSSNVAPWGGRNARVRTNVHARLISEPLTMDNPLGEWLRVVPWKAARIVTMPGSFDTRGSTGIPSEGSSNVSMSPGCSGLNRMLN